MFKETAYIALGGALGSAGRYWLTFWMAPYSHSMPWGTMIINITGSFFISFFAILTMESGSFPLPSIYRICFMSGICGGFTTFSSFSLQNMELIQAGHIERAFINIILSVGIGLLAVAAGYLAARAINQNII